jgi:hypothetical protein
MSLLNSILNLKPSPLLPPCRGKVGMGVESWIATVSTPILTLPLQGGGDEVAGRLLRANHNRQFAGSAA